MAILSDLPSELLLYIATFLEYSWGINSLGGVNHHSHAVLNPYLDQHKQQYSRLSTILWAAQHGSEPIIRNLLAYIQDKALWDSAVRLAAQHGHKQLVHLLLDARPQSQSPSSAQSLLADDLCYLLWQAATQGHEPLVLYLLERGASPTTIAAGPGVPTSEWSAQSPLSAAVINGHQSVVKAILTYSDTARTQISDLLFPAAEKQQPRMVLYLLEEGANPNARDAHGFHIMYYAARVCPGPGVRALLDHGADPNPAMPPGVVSPLRESLLYGRMPIADMLLASILEKHGGNTPCTQPEFLCAAAACDREEWVQKLLQSGSDPNATLRDVGANFGFKSHCTPLTWATEFKHENIVSLLLNHGASAMPQSLIMTLLNRSVSIAKLLLEKGGIDPNTCWKDMIIPAIYLALPHEPLFRLLLDNGANPAIRTPVPGPIILKALACGRIPQVQILLDRGFRLELPKGFPLKNALLGNAVQGGLAMLEFLYSTGASYGFQAVPGPDSERNDSAAILTALTKPDIKAVEYLLVHQKIALPTSEALVSSLEDLSERAKKSIEATQRMLDLLLSHGLNINARKIDGNSAGNSGQTVLWGAIQREDSAFLRLLLDRGANPLLRDHHGGTALHAAAAKGFLEGVRSILEWVTLHNKHEEGISRRALRAEVSKARMHAAAKDLWKIVRVLERFEYLCCL